ncbi:MAG: response regulator [Candidatus Heimdallarchaeota archaeon]|nr:response regulator [Candidatus Heimdallarchaeota archaeon]
MLDITIPKITGYELMQEIRKEDPNLPILLTSGYNNESLDELDQYQNVGFIQKPYTMEELENAIRDAVKQ